MQKINFVFEKIEFATLMLHTFSVTFGKIIDFLFHSLLSSDDSPRAGGSAL